MRTLFSLLLALMIFVAFGGLVFFFLNLSGGAKFERKAKATEQPVVK